MSTSTPQRGSLAGETVVFAGRLFLHWRRHPIVPIQALLFPTILLITYSLLVSRSLTKMTGTGSLDVLVPVCAIAGGMSGALAAGLVVPYERATGLLSRFWILPVHRASALSGTLLAEATRTLLGTVLLTAVGVALGLRFEGNWLALMMYAFLPPLVIIVFAMVVLTIAVRARTRTLMTWLGTASLGLVFSGIAPVERIPSWLRPLAQFQPMKPIVGSMRALSDGESALWPLLLSFAWLIVLAAVFGPMAIRGYRTAAETRE
jgi:ABC-2 type transport system permease protein